MPLCLSELRVGNLVLFDSKYPVVWSLSHFLDIIQSGDGYLSRYSGIPISWDILWDSGFRQTLGGKFTFIGENIWLVQNQDGKWQYLVADRANPLSLTVIAEFDYVHELQNAFAALNEGREIIRKPEKNKLLLASCAPKFANDAR